MTAVKGPDDAQNIQNVGYDGHTCHGVKNALVEMKTSAKNKGGPDVAEGNEGEKVQNTGRKKQNLSGYCGTCEREYAHIRQHMRVHEPARVKKYQCETCKKEFLSKQGWKEHQEIHENDGELIKCAHCEKEFVKKSSLLRHIKSKHDDNQEFQCEFCGEGFSARVDYNIHCRKHTKPYQCDVCGRGFAWKEVLRDHMLIHTGEKPFVCPVCGKAFRQKSGMKTHIKFVHEGLKNLTCDKCGHKSARKEDMKKHMRTHGVGLKLYYCEICGIVVRNQYTLRRHMEIHTRKLECDVCGARFPTKLTLKKHIQFFKDQDPVQCGICDKLFHHPQTAKEHLLDCHKVQTDSVEKKPVLPMTIEINLYDNNFKDSFGDMKNGEQEYAVDIKQESLDYEIMDLSNFGSDQTTIFTIEVHDTAPPYFGEDMQECSPPRFPEGPEDTEHEAKSGCHVALHSEAGQDLKLSKNASTTGGHHISRVEVNLSTIDVGMREEIMQDSQDVGDSVDAGIKGEDVRDPGILDNELAGKIETEIFNTESEVFPSNSTLQVNKRHSTAKTCDICGKVVRHLGPHKATHSEERKYGCKVCGLRFKTSALLYLHKRKHADGMPYKCQNCPKGFRTLKQYKEHAVLHSGEKPYICEICGKSFARRRNMLAHKKLHYGLRPYACKYCGKKFAHANVCLEHERIHTGVKPFVCEVCGKGFVQRSGLTSHRTIHSKERSFKCQFCDHTSSRKRDLLRHTEVHYERDIFECSICLKNLTGKRSFEQHCKIHENSYKDCEVCKKSFETKESYDAHVKKFKNLVPVTCGACDIVFHTKLAANRHMKIHATGSLVQ